MVTPAGQPAVTRHELAADLVTDVRGLDQRIAAVQGRIKTVVAQSNTSLVQLFGVGPVLAAVLWPRSATCIASPARPSCAPGPGSRPVTASPTPPCAGSAQAPSRSTRQDACSASIPVGPLPL